MMVLLQLHGKAQVNTNPNPIRIRNKANKPCILESNTDRNRHAILCGHDYAACFDGRDIRISSNPNTNTDNYLNLGNYQHAFGTSEAQMFLAGSYQFQLSKIEFTKKSKMITCH
jgi:hypothetical protein